MGIADYLGLGGQAATSPRRGMAAGVLAGALMVLTQRLLVSAGVADWLAWLGGVAVLVGFMFTWSVLLSRKAARADDGAKRR